MPRLPTQDDYGINPPAAARRPVDAPTIRQTPDLLTGRAMQDIGAMMQAEAEKMDETVAQDALNKLQEKQLELTYGESGFTKILGGDIVKRPVVSEYGAKMKSLTEALAGTINNPRARARFEASAASANRGFTQKLYVHAAEQTDKYQSDTADAGVLIGAEMAKAGDVMSGLVKATPIVEAEAARRGLSGDAAKTFKQEALGTVHAAAIDGLLSRGDTAAATLYLKTNGEAMSKKQTDHYDPIVKAQNAYVVGTKLGDETIAMGDVEAQKYITEKAGGDKAMADAAKAQRRENMAAIDGAAKETKGALVSQFSQMPSNKSAQAIYAMPQFMALPASEQGTLREYFRHQVQAAEDHSRGLSDRADAKARQRWDENPEAIAVFSELANNPELARLSTAQVYSYAPYIGPKLVGTLEGIRRSISSEGKKFSIPSTIINEALPLALQKATGEKEKQQVSAYKGIVERTLQEWKAENPGKVPSTEEQFGIARSASREVQQIGMFFGTNKVPAYALNPMTDGFRVAAQAEAAKRGTEFTEAQLLELWAKQKGSR